MNKATIIGRLTKDPEVRYSAEGRAVARFNIAVDRRSEEKKTDFIPCVAFGKTAELMEKYVFKGNKIGIVGHIQTGSYKNKEGITIYTVDVIVEELEFLESKKNNSQQPANAHSEPTSDPDIPAGFEELKDSDLPF